MQRIDELTMNSIGFAIQCNFPQFCGTERTKEAADQFRAMKEELLAYRSIGTLDELKTLREQAQQEQPNEPLAVEELREMWQEHSAVYVTNIDCTPIFGGKVCVAAVLDTVAAFGSCGGMVLQAIFGRSLTLAEGDYGKTWLAFRRRPEQEE